MGAKARRKAAKMAAAKARQDEKIARAKAEEASWAAKAMAYEAAKIAKAKAQEAELAAMTAKAKAQEAEEASKVAMAMAEEAAKARQVAIEAVRLKDKETEWAQCEEELLAANFRRIWNKLFACRGATFSEITSIPAMRYTYPDADDPRNITAVEALQIGSIKLSSIKDPLQWPLQVFGFVAVRDVLDHKRNIVFHRQRNNCQTITKEDPYLELTGPSRAVVVAVNDPTYIEVSLKVKGTRKSEDKDLSELVLNYRTACSPSCVYPSRLSTLEFEFDYLDCAAEATILIRVIGGSWPDGFRGVFSAVTTSDDDMKIKLLEFGDGGLPVDADGMVRLSRRVVSVDEEEEELIVSVVAYPMNAEEDGESSEVVFEHETCGVSSPGGVLQVGSCIMEVTVAWSLFHYP